jgi:Uma2 family endonuclease
MSLDMPTTTNLLTWRMFEQLPDDGIRHELIEGELQTLPPLKSGHSLIASNAGKALLTLEEQGFGRVLLEAGYKLSEDPATWIQPDVSFLRTERVRATSPDGYFVGSPELAIEIVSPSESARDLERKVELLLAAGAIAVWVIFPEIRRVRVFLRDGASFIRGMNDKLSAPELRPGWEAPVAKLFEE